MSALLTKAKEKYISLRGFHTDRKLVVIESDDWGSIRMPSKQTFDKLISLGDKPQNDAFLRNDCLETEDDLSALYETLCSVKDSNGNPAVITANFAVANPKFECIDYKNGVYKFEPFFQTYNRYYGENAVMEFVKKGISRKCFQPQLHCREHMNVARWMRDLKAQKADTITAIENFMIGIESSFSESNPFGYMDALNTDCSKDNELSQIIKDAHKIFRNAFGFASETFAASCYVWNKNVEKTLRELGIRYIQSNVWQNYPVGENGQFRYKRKIHFTGEKNKDGQMYSVRNCTFEPAYLQNPEDSASECFDEIKKSFSARKPAVICSHRLNYIGSVRPENRDHNLIGLRMLLKKIMSEYPETEFISSPDLFAAMESESK